MTTPEDIERLAGLARLAPTKDERVRLAGELDAILSYVGQLESLALPADLREEKPVVRNVLRKDEHPTPAGVWTEKLIAAFPERTGDALRVKRVIHHDEPR